MANTTVEQVLNKAIQREEEAYEFYTNLQKKITDTEALDALKFLANEETKHKEFLINYREGKLGGKKLSLSEVVDYKIAEYLDAPDIDKDIESKDVYLIAAHRELNSFNFYKSLAEVQPDGATKDMLFRMANEELKHKEKVEYLYTNTAFPQTQGG